MRPRSSLFPLFLLGLGFLSVVTLRSIDLSFGTNQLLFFIGAGLVYFFVSSLPFAWLTRLRWVWYLACVALLVITLVVGKATNGAVSWIHIGAYRLQPSEFLKPALMLVLATEAIRWPPVTWLNILRLLIIGAVPLAVVMLQPDLGTTLVTVFGATCVFLAARPKRNSILLLGALAILTLIISWNLFLKPYQKDRILSFFSPTEDALGSGYNAQQALVAVGSGGLWGRGFGQGLQSHLRFLPERQTDFLFATFAEEAGFIGSTILITAYALLFIAIAWFIRRADSHNKVLFTCGILGVLFIQTTINIGMNIGLLPITGVTLPLFSLGGSSVSSTAIMLGLLESARRSTYHTPQHLS